MRSPRTPFEAQLRVEGGGAKNSGFTNSQTSDSARGTRKSRPIQSRLQIESTSMGSTAKRVQTLAGLAWRIQLSPLSPKTRATRLGVVAASAAVDTGRHYPSRAPMDRGEWGEQDSNLRRQSQCVYSASPLTAWVSPRAGRF